MSLPIVKSPTFTVKIKEIKKPLTIRPMVVAEHKALQQAMDIGSEVDLLNTISDVVTSCVNNAFNAKTIERYILDYVFIQLYMTSVEDVITSRYVCKNKVTDENGNLKIDEETGDEIICNTSIDVKLPLTRIAIDYPENYEESKKIKLSDTVELHLKSLSLESSIAIQNIRDEIYELANELGELTQVENSDQAKIDELQAKITDLNYKIQTTYVYNSVERVVDGENEILPSEFDIESFVKWFESLPSKCSQAVDEFFTSQPEISMDFKIICPKCGYTREMKLRGLQDFFS